MVFNYKFVPHCSSKYFLRKTHKNQERYGHGINIEMIFPNILQTAVSKYISPKV